MVMPEPSVSRQVYRPEVIAELARHGLAPRPDTPPELLKAFINDLYRHELRQLRDRVVRKEFPQRELTARVIQLRKRTSFFTRLSRLAAHNSPCPPSSSKLATVLGSRLRNSSTRRFETPTRGERIAVQYFAFCNGANHGRDGCRKCHQPMSESTLMAWRCPSPARSRFLLASDIFSTAW